jgi:hypothetical protein
MSPIPLGILASSGAAAGSFDLLQTTVLTAPNASIEFLNLSQYASTYRHLQIRMVSSGPSPIGLRFNGEGIGIMYKDHRLLGSATVVESNTVTSGRVYIGRADEQSPAIIDILDAFANNKNKVVRSLSGDLSGEPIIQLSSGVYLSNDPTSFITLFPVGSFAATSRFSLYGIKASA